MEFKMGDGLIARSITAEDEPKLEKLWLEDPYHGKYKLPDHVVHPIHGKTQTLAIEDKDGVVAYVVFTTSLRIAFQFAPASKFRIGKLVAKGLHWIESLASSLGCSQVVYTESENPNLNRIMNRLGFDLRNEYVKDDTEWQYTAEVPPVPNQPE